MQLYIGGDAPLVFRESGDLPAAFQSKVELCPGVNEQSKFEVPRQWPIAVAVQVFKPFSFDELVARIRSLGRRSHGTKSPQIQAEGVVLDISRKDVFVTGQELHLTHAEYNVIEHLMRNRGRILSKAQLLDAIHDSDTHATSNLVEVIVSGLRKKLRGEGIENLIQTRRGFGYFIDADVEKQGANGV